MQNHHPLSPAQELEQRLLGAVLEREALERSLLGEQSECTLLRRELEVQVCEGVGGEGEGVICEPATDLCGHALC